MSWEVLLLRLPDHVTSMGDLPDDEGTPPLGPKPWVLDVVPGIPITPLDFPEFRDRFTEAD